MSSQNVMSLASLPTQRSVSSFLNPHYNCPFSLGYSHLGGIWGSELHHRLRDD